MSTYPDQTRNLNPTPAARVAMIIWGKEYSEQSGGSMDFYDKLSADRKRRCRVVVEELQEALYPPRATERDLKRMKEMMEELIALGKRTEARWKELK